MGEECFYVGEIMGLDEAAFQTELKQQNARQHFQIILPLQETQVLRSPSYGHFFFTSRVLTERPKSNLFPLRVSK